MKTKPVQNSLPLPGLFGNHSILRSVFGTGGNYTHNYTLAGVRNPLWTIAYAELGIKTDEVSATASPKDVIYFKNMTGCSLSNCLRDYDLGVANGSPLLQSRNIDFGTTYLKYTPETVPGGMISPETYPLCWMPGRPETSGFQETRDFAFSDPKMWDLANNGQVYFPSKDTRTRWMFSNLRQEWDAFTPPSSGTFQWMRSSSYNDPDPSQEQLQRVGLEQTMENIALSLTKLGLEKTNHSVNGTVYVTKVFVSVRWPWIILPGLLVIVGSVFLVITITVTKKSHLPLWKSFVLAAYYHSLERMYDENDDEDDCMTASSMEKKSERTTVQLEHSEIEGRLMLLQKGYNSD